MGKGTTMPRWIGAVAAGALALALAGCGSAPWDATTPSSTPTSSAGPAQITTVVNELANGSTQHLLAAGNIGLTVDYYSTLSMDAWTADANKPLSISMVAELSNDEGQRVYLSQMTVLVAVYGPEGALDGPEQLSDRATITPGYLVKSPYSYSQTFTLPKLDPAATFVTVSLTYELLLQTTPTSVEYAKQTAADTLTIAIAPS